MYVCTYVCMYEWMCGCTYIRTRTYVYLGIYQTHILSTCLRNKMELLIELHT